LIRGFGLGRNFDGFFGLMGITRTTGGEGERGFISISLRNVSWLNFDRLETIHNCAIALCILPKPVPINPP
jgi:hypothetical protein